MSLTVKSSFPWKHKKQGMPYSSKDIDNKIFLSMETKKTGDALFYSSKDINSKILLSIET